ncbi:DnaQ-like exonuclease [Bacillus phage 276BB001]|nr:DnaQ-like exonuclease [Bacillus phage 276BB001]QFG05979.1 DnaE-like DNA polymerase III [Bacillus phage 280BB001]QZA70128.1 DnaQ-like exonuclease [Bacillus phage 274BB002]
MNYSQIVVIDFETTGLNPQTDYPTEIAIDVYERVGLGGFTLRTSIQRLIELPQGVEIPAKITELTGLTTEKVRAEGVHKGEILDFLENEVNHDALFVAHNANFDLGFLYYHFGVEPLNFLCTRTIEVLTDPHFSASLKDAYKRYYPVSTNEQTHRASDDTKMTYELLEGQLRYGVNVEFFVNLMVNMPDRELKFVPVEATVLDFTKKYVSRSEYEKLQKELEELRKAAK